MSTIEDAVRSAQRHAGDVTHRTSFACPEACGATSPTRPLLQRPSRTSTGDSATALHRVDVGTPRGAAVSWTRQKVTRAAAGVAGRGRQDGQPCAVGPTHRRVPQPGRQGTDREHPQAGSCQTAKDDGGKPGVRFLARSKRGTRFRTASLLGGTKQRRRRFWTPLVGRDQGRRRCWWRSPDDRNWR